MKKPSDEEREYFARQEAENLKRKAGEADRRKKEGAQEARRELHYMHCPKCGSSLTEVLFRGVAVDRCEGCKGVWLDGGELETLAGKEEGGLMHQLFKTILG